MPLARIADKILFFAHIPKTGGASIESYMAAKGQIALRYAFRQGWSRATSQHMHAEIHRRLVPEAFCDQSFTVLRDPMDRLQSEYRYQRDRGATQSDFNPWARLMLGLVQSNPYVMDNHLRPQAEFLRWNMRVFDFASGLDPVFDWIDSYTRTEPGPRDNRRNVSQPHEVTPEPDVVASVARVYAGDIALLRALRDDPDGAVNNVRAKVLEARIAAATGQPPARDA